MASKEDIQRGVEYAEEITRRGTGYAEDKANETHASVRRLKNVSFNPTNAIFTTLAIVFLIKSVDFQQRDIFIWIFQYTRNWTIFSVPYLLLKMLL